MRPVLERRLRRQVEGDILFDAFSRGRYATDASHYQVMPLGVVVPRRMDDVRAALGLAREEGVPVTPRGGGTSQCGQTVNAGLVVDNSRHLNALLDVDVESRTCTVEPGIVLDTLNRALKAHGLWFPVDVSTASRATIGGMAGNNSCGARSLRYGTMRDNTVAIEAILADGSERRFEAGGASDALSRDLAALGAREAEEIARTFPNVPRRVGGYNIDALVAGEAANLAHLLVGSEGTLAYSTKITLKLTPLPGRDKVLGICHFPTFRAAMEAAQHLVALGPTSVELVDDTMIGLARDIAAFRPIVERFVRGAPAALLIVEFDEGGVGENARKLEALADVMSDLGQPGGMLPVTDPALQADIGEVRRSGLNIMMSMREAGKPVSFVEDCAVPLEHLADYTERLGEVFARHGTRGTWYAHAAVGCLHVRPVLNLKEDVGARAMRAIAEEAFAMVAEYKGSHSGEHGDGIVRSEFHARMFGPRIAQAFEAVKRRFDPDGLYNPNRIVDPPRMDDRRLFRYGPDYAPAEPDASGLDWSAWPGGLLGAAEMCNNNGACRKLKGGAMCPSYRVTRDERDSTRGRANTLRLALTGQLGIDALTSPDMADTLKLCVSCKACRRECPTGVDMARMKTEVLARRIARDGLSAKDRAVAYLPRYAPKAARGHWLMNARDRLPGAAWASERVLGFSRARSLPRWSARPFRDDEGGIARVAPAKPRRAPPVPDHHDADAIPLSPEGLGGDTAMAGRAPTHPDVLAPQAPPHPQSGDVVLFADTFNRWFEPENLRAAVSVLTASGRDVVVARAEEGESRPLCCGRTFLSVGLIEEARREAARTIAALAPHLSQGRTVVGLEPSCLLTLRDEFPALVPGETADRLAENAVMLEEYLVAEADAGRLALDLAPHDGPVLLHGHCHQKAHGVMPAVERALRLVPGLEPETIESSCCGMAGAFGYDVETAEVSRAMGELSLLPAVRAAPDAVVIADGTSCRHQIRDGADREAVHVARFLADHLVAQGNASADGQPGPTIAVAEGRAEPCADGYRSAGSGRSVTRSAATTRTSGWVWRSEAGTCGVTGPCSSRRTIAHCHSRFM